MKKSIVLLMVVGLVFGSLLGTAEAKKKKAPKPVTLEGSYQSPPLVVLAQCAQTDGIGCVSFGAPAATLVYATVEVTDASGLPVPGNISQPDQPAVGNVQPETEKGTFCGKTAEPILIDPSYSVDVWIGTQDPTCAGTATTGTVKITFSSKP